MEALRRWSRAGFLVAGIAAIAALVSSLVSSSPYGTFSLPWLAYWLAGIVCGIAMLSMGVSSQFWSSRALLLIACVAAIVFFTLVVFLVVYLFDAYQIELDYHRSPEVWGGFAVLLSAPIALVAYLIGIGWRTYRTSFFLLAGVAAITFCVSFGLLTVFWYVVGFGHRRSHFAVPPDVPGSVLSQLISTATLGVSTVTAFSTMWLAWRLDRRQAREAELRARESELRVAQLQIEVNKSRQPRTEDG